MQAWLAARQWETLFAVAMGMELPVYGFWLAGAALALLVWYAGRVRSNRLPALLLGLAGLLFLMVCVLVSAAVLSAPALTSLLLADNLRAAGIRMLADLVSGAAGALLMLHVLGGRLRWRWGR